MPDCPLADDCPSFSERIEGLGCQHYGNRGGAEWCQHYDMPISELKQQPVKVGEERVVDIIDIHESGAGVGHTDDGFVVFVDGLLPEARARVKITKVKSNHARAEVLERLPLEEDDPETEGAEAGDGDETDAEDEEESETEEDVPELGSRDNFWGG
ncbi:MAG: TRAM domain-containing protein [Halobacteriales archaeon]